MKIFLFFLVPLLLPTISSSLESNKNPTAEQRARLWKARAEVLNIQMQLQKANKNLEDINAELVSNCSPGKLQFDREGDPICVVEPHSGEDKTKK